MKLFEELDEIDLDIKDASKQDDDIIKKCVELTTKEKIDLQQSGVGGWDYTEVNDEDSLENHIVLIKRTTDECDEYNYYTCAVYLVTNEGTLEFLDCLSKDFAFRHFPVSYPKIMLPNMNEDVDDDLDLETASLWTNGDSHAVFVSDKIKNKIIEVISRYNELPNEDSFGGTRLSHYSGYVWGGIHHTEQKWYFGGLNWDGSLVLYRQKDEMSGEGVIEINRESVDEFLSDLGLSKEEKNFVKGIDDLLTESSDDDIDVDLDFSEPEIEISSHGIGEMTKEQVHTLYNYPEIKGDMDKHNKFYMNCLYLNRVSEDECVNKSKFLIHYSASESRYYYTDCYQVSRMSLDENGSMKYFEGSAIITKECAIEIGLSEADLETLKSIETSIEVMTKDDDRLELDEDTNGVELEVMDIRPEVIRHNKNFIEYTYLSRDSILGVFETVLNIDTFNSFNNKNRISDIYNIYLNDPSHVKKVQIMLRGYKDKLCSIGFVVYGPTSKDIRWFETIDSLKPEDSDSNEYSHELITALNLKMFDDEQTNIITEEFEQPSEEDEDDVYIADTSNEEEIVVDDTMGDEDIDLDERQSISSSYSPTELLKTYIQGTDDVFVVDNFIIEMFDSMIDSVFEINDDGSINEIIAPMKDNNADEVEFAEKVCSGDEYALDELRNSHIRNKFDDVQDCIDSLSVRNGWESFDEFLSYLDSK